MATVFLARDLKHDRPVALKVLHPELAASLGPERFQREVRLAARLQHPHILTVHDSGEGAGLLWFTMPYVEGESLRDRLARDTQLPIEEALQIVRQAAQALEYAHLHGVIHRDIKPENLLLTRDGNTLVADFGIARGVGEGDQRLTETGLAVGTPAYMSPEQASAEKAVDARTDVYSLGAVLFELLAGEPPFTGPTAQAIMAKRLTGQVPSLRVVRPEVPPAIDQAVRKALAPVPADRYASMAEFRRALDESASGQHTAAVRNARRAGVGIAAALVVILAVASYSLRKGRQAASPTDSLPNSAAVLPFADQSPGKDQEYFSDGLTDELTTALARLPGLRVVARSSAFQFKGTSIDVREVGRRLGVGALLEGTIRRSGNRLRVSAQLVNARDGYELWSDSYDRDLADVFQVQEDIARAITTALRVRLAGGFDSALSHRPTGDLQAYDLYLKGRFAWNQRTETTLPEAARYFEQAVARDSGFSRAWAGLADTYVLLPVYSSMRPAAAWPRAKAAALKAIALDSSSAEAYTSLAYGTMLYEWDWAASERAFRRAIAADSTYPTAHQWYGDFLAGRGRLEEALTQMGRAQELDPLSRIIGGELVWVYNSLHRANEADSALALVLRLDPNFSQTLFVLAQVRIEQQRYPEAITALRRSLELGGFFGHGAGTLIAAYARAGDRASATALLDSLTARSAHEYVAPFVLAVAYANLGEMDRAFAELDKGIKERDVLLPENFFEPLLDPLIKDPRYARVVAVLRGTE
jgi:serine/threonine-protein kinase